MKLIIQGLPPSLNALNSMHYHAKAKYKREWGQKVTDEIFADMLPKKPYSKALVKFKIFFGDQRRHDPDNAAISVSKPALDALVTAGILEDDSIDNVTLTYEFSREKPRRFEITITEDK